MVSPSFRRTSTAYLVPVSLAHSHPSCRRQESRLSQWAARKPPPVEPDLRRPQRDHVLNHLPVQVRLLSHGERLLEMKTLHPIRHNTEDTH